MSDVSQERDDELRSSPPEDAEPIVAPSEDDGVVTTDGQVGDRSDRAIDGDAAETDAEAAAQVERDLDDARQAIARERDDYLDALRRLQADFENYKKRMVRQQTELLERAGEGLVDKLLPVLDAIDLARQHGAGEGVDAIASALTDALTKEGLERIDPVGEKFDPNEHEAVAHHPAEDGDEGEVVSVLMRAGYRWKGKLLRPAMVAVRG